MPVWLMISLVVALAVLGAGAAWALRGRGPGGGDGTVWGRFGAGGGSGPETLAGARERIAELSAALAARDSELEQLQEDRAAQAQAAGLQQKQQQQTLRRRAKEAIDSTAAVIGGKLEDVVVQVGAARQAAAATHERVSHTNDAAEALVRRARSADEAATALNASLRQVAGIASVISGIASQTRLLALNATIEAVRAGAAGSGFAVVADEVKSLADTTADSTEQITSTIAALEADVAQMGETLSAIIHDVGDIEDAMRQLGGIADRQHDIVMRLHASVDATMAQIGDLSDVAERLERRRHDRLAIEGTVRLRLPSRPQPVTANMVDLSSEGLGCTLAADIPVQIGDVIRAELSFDGLGGAVDAKVMRRTPRDGQMEIGLQFQDLPTSVRNDIDTYLTKLGAAPGEE
ncbi:methyl-accepting chemotaxis protein [Actinoplanes sp. SE50]|uniref:methyl-accepting chemotaxis protein n=1 Tax=unclassified Actinoplanes TaxID=2626549 RepID=UPI00023EC14F|nr:MULTISPECIES: methyl-accepting chemotaxis protein [unclassified Actinoplanes]AEV86346.1 Methyl-accepting chemotaxis aspartate transducer [Actinoplanes sp. SE50/110]ATO84743.1 methyl-accepting chemotaxis protein [Actinoplanes sp. SE50]SLM02153.1 methyl-accepting chemotaxis protein [Actinoplanes sp. SE50/110]